MKFLTPTLLILVAIGVFFTVVEPLRADVSQLKSDIDTYNVALDNSTFLQKTERKLFDDFNSIKPADKDRIEHFLPNTVNNIKFILEVERLANQYSMPIKNIKFETPAPAVNATTQADKGKVMISGDGSAPSNYGKFAISFDVDGNYESFNLFLRDLEHNLRIVNVKSIAFAVPQESDHTSGVDIGIMTYSLKVEIYWLK